LTPTNFSGGVVGENASVDESVVLMPALSPMLGLISIEIKMWHSA